MLLSLYRFRFTLHVSEWVQDVLVYGYEMVLHQQERPQINVLAKPLRWITYCVSCQ